MRKMACLLMLVAGCGSQLVAPEVGRVETIIFVPVAAQTDGDLRIACPTFSELDVIELATIMDDAWWAGGSFQEQLDVNLAVCSDDFVPAICRRCLGAIATFVHFTVH